ncbi:ABC transporter ATP-binding protein [Oceanibacterium hippocampi]|uniref:Oligopeptide transport ATP-binding protein OppF n=1 Tax=Oceanibacterium hippocampi TaxID=745714 RepID=A0A1Y5TJF3_9PROT|nr:ATP-binding cassette domain-containing protein [Oceanibacterium hippocampi]SLN63345.1 Oligopeptide transport ATP-binding protein OppF [Oceanibacterium hippocampi]
MTDVAAPVIAFRGVGVTYRKGPVWNRTEVPAVGAVDLEIAAGETLGLVGESGSGKTTLGRVALGLIRPSRGEFLIEGRPFDPAIRREGALSVVLQHPEWALNPRLRCGVSVAEPLTIRGDLDRQARRQRVASMLERVGLDPGFAERYPGDLSGGQRQRMAIARALITEPRFIVFDEAVSALDVSVQAQILNLIRELQAEHRFAAIFISHDLAATRYISHRIAVMLKGDIVEVAPARTFYDMPAHDYSRALYATIR